MLEIIALCGLLFVAALCLAVMGFFLKILFKLLLIPLWLAGVVLKVVLTVVALALVVAFAPVLIIGLLLLAPLAILAGVVGLGAWAVA